jgi:hypothetical protein
MFDTNKRDCCSIHHILKPTTTTTELLSFQVKTTCCPTKYMPGISWRIAQIVRMAVFDRANDDLYPCGHAGMKCAKTAPKPSIASFVRRTTATPPPYMCTDCTKDCSVCNVSFHEKCKAAHKKSCNPKARAKRSYDAAQERCGMQGNGTC